MIKYNVDLKNQSITAYISGCRFDAIHAISKYIWFNVDIQYPGNLKHLEMKNSYKATVRVRDGDVFDEVKGKEYAKVKLINNYRKSFNKRITLAEKAMYDMNENLKKIYLKPIDKTQIM